MLKKHCFFNVARWMLIPEIILISTVQSQLEDMRMFFFIKHSIRLIEKSAEIEGDQHALT